MEQLRNNCIVYRTRVETSPSELHASHIHRVFTAKSHHRRPSNGASPGHRNTRRSTTDVSPETPNPPPPPTAELLSRRASIELHRDLILSLQAANHGIKEIPHLLLFVVNTIEENHSIYSRSLQRGPNQNT
ncbi:hypothetical protein YC2023_046904 [Brassica napus]